MFESCSGGVRLSTARLLLRPWRPADRPALRRLNADPEVMAHFPGLMTAAESDALADRLEAHFARHGYGFWALEVRGGPSCVGFTGLAQVPFEAAFTPAIEVGWRLDRLAWGRGYASEAARAALAFAFTELQVPEVVSFTVPENRRSRQVMQRIGMQHQPQGDFDHPALPAGHRLRRHVLYTVRRESWAAEG